MRSSLDQSFVGRDGDLTRLRSLLAGSEPVLSIVGPPGIGKTRIVRELVGGEERAVFCALDQARDVDGICRGVASGLGMSITATGSPVAQLGRSMLARSVSFVALDNVEQVLGPTREVLSSWREFIPEMKFVVTSRERLRVPGEVVHELAPLGRKGRGTEPSEALDLLLRCVARAGRTYAPDDVELSGLNAIAERLEGVPLAIELVAPLVALLGARSVYKRLSERSDLLTLSPLRATLEWSWSLLSDDERRALARCSVFVGGFTASAAEAVLGSDALDLVGALRQKSLLVVSPPPDERLGFAFSVRDLASEKLTELELQPAAELAHARCFATWADEAEETADTPQTRRELAFERENLLASAERSLASGTIDGLDRALRAATALHTLARSRGPFDGYEPLLTRALEQADAQGIESRAVVWARAARGQARRRLGRHDEALRDLEESVEGAVRLRDEKLEGRVSGRLGMSFLDARKFGPGRARLERALELARRTRDRVWEAHALYGLGIAFNEVTTPEQASDAFERAALLFEQTGARAMCGYASSHLGSVLLGRGRLEEAKCAMTKALEAHRESGDEWFESVTLGQLATHHLVARSFDAAIAGYDRALPRLREFGDERTHAVFLAHRALALQARGDVVTARADLAHAADRLRGLGDGRSSASILGWLAGVEADLDNLDAARTALEEGEKILETVEARNAAAILDCGRAVLDVAYSRAAGEREAGALLQRAKERLDALASSSEPGRGLEWSFYDVRLSLERARAVLAAASTEPRAPAVNPASITIDPDARWIVGADGTRHSLARKVTLRRVLRRLIDARRATPNEPVSSEELVALGWPDERMNPAAAMNRLRVAVARLRQLGLEGALIGERGGYLLDPEAPLAIEKVALPTQVAARPRG